MPRTGVSLRCSAEVSIPGRLRWDAVEVDLDRQLPREGLDVSSLTEQFFGPTPGD